MSLWKNLWNKSIFRPAPEPRTARLATNEAQPQIESAKQPVASPRPLPAGYPATYLAQSASDTDRSRVEIFEPALRQHSRAFRLSDPAFQNREQETAWRDAQSRAMYEVARRVSESPWAEHLVLRGSLLLETWLGEHARRAGDIDWVYQPEWTQLNNRPATELFAGLQGLVADHPEAGPIRFEAHRIAVDDIWSYERAPGRRIVFPWRVAGLPPGVVQMDVVFNERLFEPPELTELSPPDGHKFLDRKSVV